MNNFTLFTLFMVIVVLAECTEKESVRVDDSVKVEEDPSLRRSYMTVRVVGNGSGQICASCWSGDHNNDRQGCSSNSSDAKVLAWNFNSGASTKFWCSGTWGSKQLRTFPVFGDGVPKKSSDWLVNVDGKKRTHEDGKQKNDYPGWWAT